MECDHLPEQTWMLFLWLIWLSFAIPKFLFISIQNILLW